VKSLMGILETLNPKKLISTRDGGGAATASAWTAEPPADRAAPVQSTVAPAPAPAPEPARAPAAPVVSPAAHAVAPAKPLAAIFAKPVAQVALWSGGAPVARQYAVDKVHRIPSPPANLTAHVVYPDTTSAPFVDFAVKMKVLTPAQADDVRQRQLDTGMAAAMIARNLLRVAQADIDAVMQARLCTIYVSERHVGQSTYQTWRDDIRRLDHTVRFEEVDARVIEEMRTAKNFRLAAEESKGQDNLNDVKQILSYCAAIGGSDLHVLQREDHTELQIRVKGDLKTMKRVILHPAEGEAFDRAMYTGLATVKEATYNPLSFQDAQIKGDSLPGTMVSSIRIIRGPMFPVETGGGFSVARLQYLAGKKYNNEEIRLATERLGLAVPERPEGEFRLGKMGFTPLQVELLERLIRRSMGIIVVTGPTGSGKTTTLYEVTKQQARLFPHTRLVTIENPPEYPMPWAIQLSCRSDQFPEMVRYSLRMDPNAILLGEIRGVDEALAALQAAMTGHLVLTTLHVTDPFESFLRLELLDNVRLSRKVVCNHKQVIGLVSQRRVPILCPHCSQTLDHEFDTYPAYLQRALKSWAAARPYGLEKVRVRGEGCEKCNHLGIIREQAVAEVVVTDEQLMADCIEHGVLIAARNHRKRPGSDKSMIEHAMDLVLEGELDPSDAEHEVDEIPMWGLS
jgi:type II secretory ATPase GspE/PulE/Tfp pilus assembly ATPase PilB-like protein